VLTIFIIISGKAMDDGGWSRCVGVCWWCGGGHCAVVVVVVVVVAWCPPVGWTVAAVGWLVCSCCCWLVGWVALFLVNSCCVVIC